MRVIWVLLKAAAALLGLCFMLGLAFFLYFGIGFGMSQRDKRRVLAVSEDPSGRWVAVLLEIDCVHGLAPPAYDGVCLVPAGEPVWLACAGDHDRLGAGEAVFAEYLMPDAQKPKLSWRGSRLAIEIAGTAEITLQEDRVDGVEIEVRKR